MPKVSRRQRLLKKTKHELEVAIVLHSSSDEFLDTSDSDHSPGNSSNSDSDNALEEFIFETKPNEVEDLSELYFLMYNSRYIGPREVTPKSDEFATQFFHQSPDAPFRQMTRMDKPTFLISSPQSDTR